jgi:hypothetical protein
MALLDFCEHVDQTTEDRRSPAALVDQLLEANDTAAEAKRETCSAGQTSSSGGCAPVAEIGLTLRFTTVEAHSPQAAGVSESPRNADVSLTT